MHTSPGFPDASVSRTSRRGAICSAVALGLAYLPGCVSMRSWLRPADPFARQPCVLPPEATVEQIVAHLNQNVDRLHGWRASGVGIRANGFPLHGELAVQKGRRLRLRVNSPLALEVDLGSNEEIFWFWARQNKQPHVYYARHEDADVAVQQLNLPFEPQWLMEAFGMESYDPAQLRLQPGLQPGTVQLVSDHILDNGWQVRRIVVVDLCHGLVREHTLWDSSRNGKIIASAHLSEHFIDPQSGVVLPRRMELDWPQAEMRLTMELGAIQVNPTGLSEHLWEMPVLPQTQAINLGRSARASLDE
jgi:hypothetical protein